MGHALDPANWTATVIETTAQAMLARAVTAFEAARNTTLAATDVRYLFMQRVCRSQAQARADIATARAVGVLRFVGADWIELHDDLYGEVPDGPAASEVTVTFTLASSMTILIPSGTRVTDGTNVWSAAETELLTAAASVDVLCTCTVTGTASNGVAVGAIDTLVDPVAGVASVSNTTSSSGGTDGETTEQYRTRLRTSPESTSIAGSRKSYEGWAKEVSSSVLDAVAIGPDDSPFTAGAALDPGDVNVLITSADADDLDPSTALKALVLASLTVDDVRPVTDVLGVGAPSFVSFDIGGFFEISNEDVTAGNEDAIIAAVEQAVLDYVTWQQGKIGRDINPSELIRRVMDAGAWRVSLTAPTFTALKRDECARADNYLGLGYGGSYDE